MRSIWEFTPIFLGDPEKVPFTFWTSIPHLNKGTKLDGWFSNFKNIGTPSSNKVKIEPDQKGSCPCLLEVGPSRGSARVPALLGSPKPHGSDFRIQVCS